MSSRAKGFALVGDDGALIVSTVSATERAAMVNALVSIYGRMVYADHTDERIKRDFERCKGDGHAVVPVTITRADGQ